MTNLARVGVAWCLIGGTFEVGVAKSAVASPGNSPALADPCEIGHDGHAIGFENLRAWRHLQHGIIAIGPGAVLSHALAAILRLEVLPVAVVDERVEIIHALHPDVAALAAIAAVGSAELDVLLAPEADAPVTAVAGLHVDLRLVEKLHAARLLRRASIGRLR